MTQSTGDAGVLFWALALVMVALAWALLCLPVWRRSGRDGAAQPSRPDQAGASGDASGETIAAPRARSGSAEVPVALGAVGMPGPTHGVAAAERARIAANAAVLGEQLNALDADLAAGRIDAVRHLAAQTELHRRLLAESGGRTQPDAVAGDSSSAGGTASGAAAERSAGARRDRRRLSIALAALLPAVVISAYLALGDPKALSSSVAASAAVVPEPSPADVAAMVDRLAEGLRRRPDGGRGDLQGWILVGRSYAALQRFDDAATAYARALDIAPDNPQLLADRADMLAMQQGQRLEGEPRRLIERALALDPKQLKALALAGSAAFARHEWAAASGYWQRARKLVDDGSDLAQGLDRSLAEVAAAAADGSTVATSQTASISPATATTSAPPATPARSTGVATPAAPAAPAARAAAVTGTVRLAPGLGAKIAPGDTVFIFARATRGPRMPLAILRRTAADLPIDFRLDDSLAMSPALKLSSFADVVIGARVSKSGNAMPQPGDLVGEATAVPGGATVQITVDRVQP